MDYDYYEIDGQEVVGVGESVLMDRFHNELNDYPPVDVLGQDFPLADVLSAVDYIKYREGFFNWLDGEVYKGTVFESRADAEESLAQEGI